MSYQEGQFIMKKLRPTTMPMNENKDFQRKVKQLPRYKNTHQPDPAAFVDLMMEVYPWLFEALKNN
jgi:hypothetical protein